MDRKVNIYLTNGGVEVWLVYPKTRSVWIYREGHAEEFRSVLRSSLLPGLEIDINQLFD
jgi:Uma2 family endonuclease